MPEPTLHDLMQAPALTLPVDASVAQARAHGQQVQVVVDDRQHPLAILTPEHLAQLAGDLPLDAQRSALPRATLVSPHTRLSTALHAMRYDKFIRWFVVVEQGQILGIVPPGRVFEQAVARSEGTALWAGGTLPGDPITPPAGLCYHCLLHADHIFSPEAVEDRDALGRALCPHDGTMLIPEHPCCKEP
ncbi:MAG: CBS domain-containing protein [Chloroflexi bacterium]|nr:CBS domain-containing protein [Chloroflexota bacterium]